MAPIPAASGTIEVTSRMRISGACPRLATASLEAPEQPVERAAPLREEEAASPAGGRAVAGRCAIAANQATNIAFIAGETLDRGAGGARAASAQRARRRGRRRPGAGPARAAARSSRLARSAIERIRSGWGRPSSSASAQQRRRGRAGEADRLRARGRGRARPPAARSCCRRGRGRTARSRRARRPARAARVRWTRYQSAPLTGYSALGDRQDPPQRLGAEGVGAGRQPGHVEGEGQLGARACHRSASAGAAAA